MTEQSPVDAADQLRRQEIDEIGRAVKEARNARGWSLRHLATEAGVSASLVSAIETGKIVPTVGSLFAISDALDEPAHHFFPARRRPSQPTADEILGTDSAAVAPLAAIRSSSTATVEPENEHLDQSAPAAEDKSETGQVAVDDGAPSKRVPSERTSALADRAQLTSNPPEILVRTRLVRRAGSRVRSRGGRSASSPASTPGQQVPQTTPGAARSSLSEDEAVRRDRKACPISNASGRRGSPAGVEIVHTSQPAVIRLGTGTTWSLPFSAVTALGQLIDVSIPAGTPSPAVHHVRGGVMEVVVLAGELTVDAAFEQTLLTVGDRATVPQGVPYRLLGGAEAETRFLVGIAGQWDGQI